MKSYSKWILTGATVLLMQGMYAREHWGPPPACPQEKVDCCPKPKCEPKCEKPKPCKPKPCKKEPKPCKPVCEPVCDPCCPPVCFERGFPTDPCCTPSAYSEPAAFDMRCGYDAFITVDFLYWQAKQGGMDLAVPGEASISPTTGILTSLTPSALGFSVLVQDFDYKPGFKVGIGWEGAKDNWVLFAEYTRLYGETHDSAQAPSPNVATVNNLALPQNGVWIPTSWFTGVYVNNATTHISSEWNYGINLVDASLSRPFYSGARLTLEPFFGLRGAWIIQSMELTATNVPTTGVPVPFPTRKAHYYSHTACVGPRIGLNTNWHLGYGFRFVGDAAASILYTGFDVKQDVDSPDGASPGNQFPVRTRYHDYNVVRTNFDMSLGFGWGSYFLCRRMHWDLAATYDFAVFTGQNMMRYLADLSTSNNSHPGGGVHDLYLHGLTIKTQFDF